MVLSRLILSLSCIFLFWANVNSVSCCYKTMFTFGDSITDTGNTIDLGLKPAVAQNPYGMTYFYAPNGRYCNGRIIIDFIAASQGLQFLPPYGAKKCGIKFEQGANFAVAGATVLNQTFYEERNVTEPDDAKYCLSVQLGWFKHLLSKFCNSFTDCRDFLSTSLIFMGEFGGDDYIHPLESNISIEEVRTYVPLVVAGISHGVQTLIDLGASTIVVPGIFPLGCSLELLTYFESPDKTQYDPRTGCLLRVDELVQYHNALLQKELDRLRPLYTNATIVFADYYKAALPVYLNPVRYGFNRNALYACCGGGGEYNFNFSALCGPVGVHVCTDPSRYVVWDGRHMTEKAYSVVVDAILSGEVLTPPINLSCPTLQLNTDHGYFDQK